MFIVEETYGLQAQGEHGITIWRYIGDAVELGYTIKTTGADDAIVQ